MRLSVLAVLIDTLGRVVQVETMIGDNSGLAKAIEVPLSLFTTALLTLAGIPVHSLVDRDRATSSGRLLWWADSLSHRVSRSFHLIYFSLSQPHDTQLIQMRH